jgi:hypothetical protein
MHRRTRSLTSLLDPRQLNSAAITFPRPSSVPETKEERYEGYGLESTICLVEEAIAFGATSNIPQAGVYRHYSFLTL